MDKGISVYPGLDNTHAENLGLIKEAAKLGIRRIFTSLHIPELDKAAFQGQLQELLATAKKYNMDVVADISPACLELLQLPKFDLAAIQALGLTTLRLDYGFSVQEIAELSKNKLGIRLQLNASTLDESLMHQLQDAGCSLTKLEALHNFFPRENTGLAEEFVLDKNRLLHQYGIQTGAFVPSFHRPRSPLGAGLPTLELHRETSFDFSIRHLAALEVDSIFIGDSLPSQQELSQLAQLTDEYITLKMEPDNLSPQAKELLQHTFTTRPDEARDVVRTCESRGYCKSLGDILADTTGPQPRPLGTITLDNMNYQRYQGELQITKCPLPADSRVNILGHLSPTEQRLLPYLPPNRQFKIVY